MKKIILCVLPFFCAFTGFSSTWQSSTFYRGESEYYQVGAFVNNRWSLSFFGGLEARYTDEKAFKDPIYSVYLPLDWEGEFLKLKMTPFYYFKNKSHQEEYQDASAMGISGRLIVTLQQDDVDSSSSHAYVGASFAQQKGTLFMDNGTASNQSYKQTAYTLGLQKDFFNIFSFEAFGNIYQYPDGITGVAGWRGILNQRDLAEALSLDINHELGKYNVGVRLTRMWPERPATVYLAYRFGEFYSAEPEHSFLLGNTFVLADRVNADLAYNHLRTIHNHNKRDVFYVRLNFIF